MAINTTTLVIISGAASTTLATAVTNFNTAVATLYANAGGAIWNTNSAGPTPLGGAEAAMAQDAAVANVKYSYFQAFIYPSAS